MKEYNEQVVETLDDAGCIIANKNIIIDNLQAKVAELEEEKKELQALLDFDNARLDQIEDELEDVEYLGPYVEGIKVLKKQLAAAQEECEFQRNAHKQAEELMLEQSNQLAAAREEIANETAEVIARMLENGSFLTPESRVALAANGAAKAIRNGAWKEFKK